MKPGREWPGVGTGAVVLNDGCLLMVQRGGSHGEGTWSVPGGWVEMWEDPMAGAARETMEETGLAVLPVSSLGWTDARHRDEGVHAVTLWVKCVPLEDPGKARVVEPEKCPAVKWVPVKKVAYLHLFHPMASWWPEYAAERGFL